MQKAFGSAKNWPSSLGKDCSQGMPLAITLMMDSQIEVVAKASVCAMRIGQTNGKSFELQKILLKGKRE